MVEKQIPNDQEEREPTSRYEGTSPGGPADARPGQSVTVEDKKPTQEE